ncbi:hypothetical protein HCN44_010759 [Aphidius gifuensis]|uniref:Uncharacterized protein n=1 Tax=Aphidius gifuensis TaxID=684658 RepID=A0A834XT21_APHGI|nr:hypothetical protein HCN44_010759 [Aphidius gifuensis]
MEDKKRLEKTGSPEKRRERLQNREKDKKTRWKQLNNLNENEIDEEEEEELSSEEESQENEKKVVKKEEKENNDEVYKMNNDESKPQALTEEQMREEWKRRKERKCNICITGCIPETWNTKENIEKELEKYLKSKIQVKEIEIVKESEIKVKLMSWEDKRIIMIAKGELKGSDMWIDDDMTDREKGVQKWLRDKARNETKRGKTAHAKYQKLLIGREEWNWNERTGTLEKKKWSE